MTLFKSAKQSTHSHWSTKAALVASALLGTAVLPASAAPTSMFILDVSGSMWGRIEADQTKIEVARDVMGGLLTSLPSGVSAGLIAYGHRRKGDCSDIEVIRTPQAGAGSEIAGQLSRLVPRGKTPIADALQMAGESLTGVEDKTTVVLVSDGIETCQGDPCAVAEALAKSHSNLAVHVVGYGVDAKAREQLQCVAEKGGGQYFPANDVEGLTTALNTVAESIIKEEPVPEPVKVNQPEVKQASTTTTKLTIAGPGTIKLKLAPWAKMPKYWKLVDPETGEQITKTSKDSLKVKAGTYQIVWRQVEHGARETELSEVITVESKKTTTVPITTGLRLVAPEGMKRPYYVQLLADEGDLETWHSKRQPVASFSIWDPVPVPVGKYTLVFRQSEHGHGEVSLGQVEIKAGQLTDVILDQGVNLDWPAEWKTKGKDRVYYMNITDQAGRAMKVSNRGPIVLAPGQYKLGLRITEHGHSEADWGMITVPEKGFADPKITSGITFVTEEKAKHTIYAVNLDTKKEANMSNRWGPLALAPGRYRIDFKPDRADRYTIVDEVEIKAGQMIEAEM